jgi:predicted AlkP superfamily phosphohydrolase/phosphomutase
MGHVGQIYLNVAGREPKGIVTEADYKQKRQEVLDALGDLKDKNGRPLITKIILREETYQGPYAEFGPDIHLILDDYNMIAFPLFATDNKVITQQIRGDSGCHRREGIFIAHGTPIKEGGQMDEANILDLAPTIMHLMGQPVPRRMDGRVLTEIFNNPGEISYLDDAEESVGDSQALSDEDTAQVEERLRSLG